MDEHDHINELRRAVRMGGRSISSKGNKRFHDGAMLDAYESLGSKASEDEIARRVFGSKADRKFPSYVTARSRLKNRLLILLGHLHFRTGSEMRRAIYRNGRSLFWARVLLTLGARPTALQLLKRALKDSRRFELTLNRIQCLEMLAQDTALRGKKTLYKKYDEELVEAFQLALAEREGRRYNELLDIEYAYRAGRNPVAEANSLQYAERCRELFDEHPSFQTGLAYYRMSLRSRELSHDSRGAIAVATEAEAYLQQNSPLATPANFGEFSLSRAASSFHINDLTGGLDAVNICAKFFPSGTNNWFAAKQYEFLLSMHTRDFARSRKIHEGATSEARFVSLPEHSREKWLLFERYLLLVERRVDTKLFRMPKGTTSRELFHEFTLDIPVYSKDKAGYNIALLILHIIYLLGANRCGEIITRAEALGEYYRRYAKTNPASPTAGFIRTLILLEKHDFKLNSLGIEGKRAKKIFLGGKDELEDCQALPYPLLWDIFLGLIEDLPDR